MSPRVTLRRFANVPRRRAGLAALLLGLAAAPAAAQPDPHSVEELAPGVFAVLRPRPTFAAEANVLVIVNEHDVVVVDANIYPTSAREAIAEIRRRTDKPVRYVVNTHFHSDHHYGNAEYRKAWPGVEFIQHPRTRELIISEDIPSLERNFGVEYPRIAKRYEDALATGKRSDGSPLPDSLRAPFRLIASRYRYFIEDVRGLEQIPGTLTVSDSLVLHRGERTIVVKWLGKGNTPGDLVVHLPRERIVATGDLVVNPTPFGFGSFVGEWPTTLRRLKALDPVVIMPGHGPPMRDWAYVDRLIALFEDVHAQVRRAVAAGADLEATRKAVDLSAWRQRFAGDDQGLRASFDANFTTPIVEAAFNEVTAARPPGPAPGR